MKLPKCVATTLIVALSAWSLTSTAMAVRINIGSGPDRSYFVLESPNLGIRTYNIHYGGGTPAPTDGYDLFEAVLAADPSLNATVFNYGSPANPNYIVNDIRFGGTTEINTAVAPWSPSWTHWVVGGDAGFPSGVPVPDDSWSIGSGMSSPYRALAPGSWDALVYADYTTPPSISTVADETGASILGLSALMIGFLRRQPRS